MAAERQFRRFTREEAKYCVDHWHYSGTFCFGTDFFGAEQNGELIACVIYIDCRGKYPTIGELVATVKNPEIKFQISQLLKYSRKQLKHKYDMLVTFCDTQRSKGGQYKGDYWNYHGIVANYQLSDLSPKDNGYHLYWVQIGKACPINLERLPYPHG